MKVKPALQKRYIYMAEEILFKEMWAKHWTRAEYHDRVIDLAAHIQDSISEWLGEQRRVASMNVAAE